MNKLVQLKRPITILFVLVALASVLFSFLAYRTIVRGGDEGSAPPAQTKPRGTPTATPTPEPPLKKIILPVQSPAQVLGIERVLGIKLPGIPWARIAHPNCGWGNEQGVYLQHTIESYHQLGKRVLLTVCQNNDPKRLYDSALFADIAQGGADAVQCGNEQMKQDSAVSFLYTPPQNFAKFYDMCERAVHKVRKDIPVLLGSLDPHVGGVDYQPLQDQADYLDQVQDAMNKLHPGVKWSWRSQTLGLIDSWHNGYPDASVNSLAALFSFWAQQFGVDLNRGELGKHLWVVEGTGCFKGCGVDSNDKKQVAVSHIISLVTNVQTSMKYGIPFFYFSSKDFQDQGITWPIGILDQDNRPKPLRQDLPMGARKLELSCPEGKVVVADQLTLLAKLYSRCALPKNYNEILTR